MAKRQTPLQQLRASKRNTASQQFADLTPLTESQRDPQLRKLAGMRALQRVPQSNYKWASRPVDHNQLTLNDAPGGENFYDELRATKYAMRDRAAENFTIVEDTSKNVFRRKSPKVSTEDVSTALKQSSMPNEALEALGNTVVVTNRMRSGAAGEFIPGPNSEPKGRRGLIGINSTVSDPRVSSDSQQFDLARVLTHEIGHEAENLARGATGQTLGRTGLGQPDREWVSPDNYASSSAEGFADGIALRFGTTPKRLSRPPEGPDDEAHAYFPGYRPGMWKNPLNQTAYVAHRAHAWSTGELPTGPLPERIHRMGANPDVRDAIKRAEESLRVSHVLQSPHNPPESSGPVFDEDAQVHGPDQRLSGYIPITDVAKYLSEQFMNTRKTGRQLSLLGEQDEYDTYDVDKVDWDS